MSGINEFVKTYLEERGYAINGRAAEIIGQADDWYRVRMTSEHKMVTVNGEGYTLDRMGFAKRAAADDANLCEVIKINAGNMENEFVQQILLENRFSDAVPQAAGANQRGGDSNMLCAARKSGGIG